MLWAKPRAKRTTLSEGRYCFWVWIGTFLSMSPSLSSCASLNPYDNWKAMMDAKVSESIDNDPYGVGAQPVDIKTLSNGNLEFRYVRKNFRGSCKYFFEVDKTTRKVIAWRYDGEDKDKACFVNP